MSKASVVVHNKDGYDVCLDVYFFCIPAEKDLGIESSYDIHQVCQNGDENELSGEFVRDNFGSYSELCNLICDELDADREFDYL